MQSLKRKTDWQITFDIILAIVLSSALILNLRNLFIVFSIIGALPVIKSTISALFRKKLTIDLLASIALLFSFLAGAWFSAVFINLMLASARIFDGLTQKRAKNITERLLKYRPSKVKIKKENKFLEFLGTAEINSHHPVGQAVVQFLQKKNISIPAPDEFNEVPGEGIWVVKNKEKFFVGKILFLEKNGVEITSAQRKILEEIMVFKQKNLKGGPAEFLDLGNN